jgi:methyltransferase-like protein/predicted O-methyltransferase YrrM
MAEDQDHASSYDEVPYESHAYAEAHPDRMAVVATLFGMTPPPVATARVLELGCASGGNLIPMALALPEARFVGVDRSGRQVADGRATIAALGLSNVELRAMSLAEVGEDFGPFDYIICHGLYSWVTPALQEAILALCRRDLAPSGVAYVSHNCYPGWHARGAVREMMEFHVRSIAEPRERARQARALLELMARSSPDRDSLHAQLLRQEAAKLRGQSDAYLLHDHLEAENHPVAIHEFVARAAVHGLQYVGDARVRTMADSQPPAVREVLDRLAGDPVRREQYLDYLRNRNFRRSLLCRDGVALTRPATAEGVMTLRVSTRVAPVSARTDLHSAAVEEFRGEGGAVAATGNPLVKAALRVLAERWPRSLPFEDLRRLALGRLILPSGEEPAPFDRGPKALAEALLQAFLSDVVELHAHEPDFVAEVGEHPTASPLARLQAESGPRVTNLRHRVVQLSDFDRLVLRQLDGRRDWYAILDALDEAVAGGAFPLYQDGQPLKDPLRVRQVLGKSLDPSLTRLATSALLVG